MIITSLVVLPLLLPYILLLLFAKSLRHWTCANEYTRPILEAIHAPYKNDKQYWFVARLLLLIMMYLLYSIEPYQHTIYIAIASILACLIHHIVLKYTKLTSRVLEVAFFFITWILTMLFKKRAMLNRYLICVLVMLHSFITMISTLILALLIPTITNIHHLLVVSIL